MAYLNANLYNKVYLLEFKQNSVDTDTFAFSVPPQSEQFSYPQRIGETKTFGGVIFEDYGNDAVSITLSGSTINQELKYIYSSTNGISDTIDGEEEIDRLQKIVRTWGSIDKLSNKSITLTNLMNLKTWQVVIKDLQIKRSKENPLAYNYTINFAAIAEPKKIAIAQDIIATKQKLDTSVKTKKTIGDKIKNFCTSVKEKLDLGLQHLQNGLNTYSSWYEAAHDAIKTIENEIDTLNDYAENYISTINGFAEATTQGFLLETLGYAEDLVGTAYKFVFDSGNKLYTEAAAVSQDIITFVKKCETDFCDGELFNANTISPNLLDQYNTTTENIIDTWKKFYDDIRADAEEIIVETKTNEVEKYSANPGSGNNDDEIIKISGYKSVIVTDADTWDSLSMKYYGVSTYGPMLAYYNENNCKELSAGAEIFVPLFSDNRSSLDNLVYNPVDEKDNYGKDIKLDDEGEITFFNDDISLSEGKETIKQAITLRLSTQIESRIKLSVYGIKTSVGRPDTAVNLIKNSVEDTLLADPRIQSVENITVYGEGDNVNLTFVYTDINDVKHIYGGTF